MSFFSKSVPAAGLLFPMFAIFDKKSAVFHPPFHAKSEEDVARSFLGAFVNSLMAQRAHENQFFQFAEDFAIYRCGCFGDDLSFSEVKPSVVAEMIQLRDEALGNVRSLINTLPIHTKPQNMSQEVYDEASSHEPIRQ